MTDSTVVVLGLTPTGELHECEACYARWDVPLGSDEDDIDTREYRLGLIADHVCDPFVDPTTVLAIRHRADELSAEVGPCPVDKNTRAGNPLDWDALDAYSAAERARGEALAFEFDYDLAALSVARCCGGWTSVADDIIRSAEAEARNANREPKHRALVLARTAVYPGLRQIPLSPRRFRPSDARLAQMLIDEVRGDDAAREWSPVEASDAEALEWLEAFEREARGVF